MTAHRCVQAHSTGPFVWIFVCALAGILTGCIVPSDFDISIEVPDSVPDSVPDAGNDTSVDTGRDDTVPDDTVLDDVSSDSVESDAGDTISTCADGTANCDGDPGNGCEADLSAPETCGACDVVCGPEALCSPAGCQVALAQIDTGYRHSCGITFDGDLYCWGANDRGQLGAQISGPVLEPRLVTSMTDVVSVSTGFRHTCAVRTDETVWCWGLNANGQLGNGTRVDASAPQQVISKATGAPLSGVVQVETSINTGEIGHSCARTSGGEVYCWGANNKGQVAATGTSTEPFAVQAYAGGLAAVEDLAVGIEHTCALQANVAHCWGEDTNGRTGIPIPGSMTGFQMDFSASHVVSQITAGAGHTCALVESGGATGVRCWGANPNGVLGNGTTANSTAHVAVVDVASSLPIGDIAFIDSGERHMCAVRTDSSVWCWGNNDRGQLGLGHYESSVGAARVLGSGASQVALGYRQTCALSAAGEMMCWGGNADGEHGVGWASTARQPVPVSLPGVPIRVRAGDLHSCALLEGQGGVYCWGYNAFGQLGDSSNITRTSPVRVVGLQSATALDVGRVHTCALADGQVYCWGKNSDELMLGSDLIGDQDEPHLVELDPNTAASEILVAGTYAMAKVDAQWWSWGANRLGQAAQTTLVEGVVPGVTTLEGVDELALGTLGGCATRGPEVLCWGGNGSGQLGYAGADSPTPVPMTGLPATGTRVALSSGIAHNCAAYATAAGELDVWCWGWNQFAQLGVPRGAQGWESTPQRVALGKMMLSELASGSGFNCVRDHIDRVTCWGSNVFGQLGVGWDLQNHEPQPFINSLSPSAISLGGSHGCAIEGTEVLCWGDSGRGQVGDGRSGDVLAPPKPAF